MSILIKGMDMPKSCGECRFESAQYVNNYCRRTFCSLGADYEHCPLIEIPTPHGRLIDADTLPKDMFLDTPIVLQNDIDVTPTIIEAEE